MAENNSKKLAAEHQGDHHYAKVAVDPNTKAISAGVIYNFSNNAATSLQIIDGKLEGSVLHTGDTHTLKIDAMQDGKFEGSFKDTRYGGIEVAFQGGLASLIKGKVPEGGIEIKADHHSVSLNRDTEGNLIGAIKSKAVKGGTFQLQIQSGNIKGSFLHEGKNHETELIFTKDGWAANLSFGKGDAKLNFSVEQGKVETKAYAGMKFKF